MQNVTGKFVLGSNSPRRRELLALIVPPEQITIVSPSSDEEATFDGLNTWSEIEQRLQSIAHVKNEDVLGQLGSGWLCVLTADTVVVGAEPDGTLVALEKPPEEDYENVVRDWFTRYYLGRTHVAATAVCLTLPDGSTHKHVVKTEVTFAASAAEHLDWYLATDEPRGKAGGYAIQGAGSLFVERVEGSLSNVVGLPLRTVREMLLAAKIAI